MDCPINKQGTYDYGVEFPSVTVITVNYKNPAGLRRTLESVAMQDYRNYEFIVKDGGSGGGDSAVLEQYQSIIDILDSSPDLGIYDAMNVAVGVASSDWVIFMNSGDVFYSQNALSDLVYQVMERQVDVVCGVARIVNSNGEIVRVIQSEPPSILPRRMNACHQAMLIRRELLLRFPFVVDPRRSASDYGFMLDALVSGSRIESCDVLVADCEAGGVSQSRRLSSLFDRIQNLKDRGIYTRRLRLFYCALLLKASLRVGVERLFGILGFLR